MSGHHFFHVVLHYPICSQPVALSALIVHLQPKKKNEKFFSFLIFSNGTFDDPRRQANNANALLVTHYIIVDDGDNDGVVHNNMTGMHTM